MRTDITNPRIDIYDPGNTLKLAQGGVFSRGSKLHLTPSAPRVIETYRPLTIKIHASEVHTIGQRVVDDHLIETWQGALQRV